MHTLPLRSLAKYALLCAPLAIVACDDDDVEDIITSIDDSPTVVLEARDELETLEEAVDRVDLGDALNDASALTLFAPNNGAFDGVDVDALSDEALTDVLLYHALLGVTIPSDSIAQDLTVVRSSDNAAPSLIINNANGSITVNDASVVTPDVLTDNGVIHVIDEVLMMPTIVDLATYVPSLSGLVSAVTQAELVEALSATGGDGFTVFAPSNDAFTRTPTTGLSNERLGEILQYHVVSGVVLAGDIEDGDTVTTLAGVELTLNVGDDGAVTITDGNSDNDDATVTLTNVRGTNGVVHVINNVLLPE